MALFQWVMRVPIILLCYLPFARGSQTLFASKFQEDKHAMQVPPRLQALMRSYYEDASQRITELNQMRFIYEESPNYHMGYVMHEVIERYKKMVELMHRIVDYKTNTVYDNLERTEQIQKLYFEIYHLVNMIHEIPQEKLSSSSLTKFVLSQAEIDDLEDRRQRERKRELKKRRELLLKGLLATVTPRPGAKRVPYNKHWPLDYGWEINWW